MANKTKNELIQEIEDLKKELNDKEADLIQYEELSACSTLAEKYKTVYDSYISAGFTADQAMTILNTIIQSTIRGYMSDVTNNRRYQYGRYYR
jgi:hypothetical protein